MTKQTNFDAVGEFHTKFGLPSVSQQGAYPRHPDDELRMFRVRFLIEELREYMEAQGLKLVGDEYGNLDIVKIDDALFKAPDHAGMFDALLDLAYVTHGAAHIHGYPWQDGWDLVQEANMTKERATSAEQSSRGGTWDVIKPPGWTPPDIAGLLRETGWGIPE